MTNILNKKEAHNIPSFREYKDGNYFYTIDQVLYFVTVWEDGILKLIDIEDFRHYNKSEYAYKTKDWYRHFIRNSKDLFLNMKITKYSLAETGEIKYHSEDPRYEKNYGFIEPDFKTRIKYFFTE